MKTFIPTPKKDSWNGVPIPSPPANQTGAPWLLLDMNNLAWRAHHTKKDLSYNGKLTGAIFGVLRDIKQFQTRFGVNCRPVFCFDYGKPLRKKVYPQYKANRKMDPNRKEVRRQADLLRSEILLELGYANVFYAEGYEGDDIIASVAKDDLEDPKYRSMIISGDQDLYQLLDTNCFQYHPTSHKIMTPGKLVEEYGVGPTQWPMVKALCGCEGDYIKGIPGVGPKTACDYMAKKPLKPAQSNRLTTESMAWAVETNLPLVCLPYPGCPQFDLRDDEPDPDKWLRVCRRFGIRSLGA